MNLPASAGWRLTFGSGVTAVGLDVFQNLGGGGQSGSPIDATVDVFGTSGLIGSFFVTIPSGSAGFMGVFSDSDLITSLTINHPDSFDVIDNVEFGGGGGGTAVPEPGTFLLVGTAIAAAIARRRFTKRLS